MRIENLTTDNVNDYLEFLKEDNAEWIGRKFVSGFVLIPDDENIPKAGIIWELINGEDEFETNCRILFIKADDEECADALLSQYSDLVVMMECEKSVFELPTTLGDIEKNALEKAGFELSTEESEIIHLALADLGMAIVTDKDRKRDDIKKLSEVDERMFDVAVSELEMDGIRGVCSDLSYLPKDFFDNEISSFLDDEGDISAMVLFHKKPSGIIEIDLMSAIGDSDSDPIELLKQSIMYSDEIYEPNTKFLIDMHDKDLNALVQKYFAKFKAPKVIRGFRKENLLPPDDFDEDDIEYIEDVEEEDIYDLY